MTKEVLLATPIDNATAWMEKAAIWASEWCIGATDQPKFIASKVLPIMCQALKDGKDPIEVMNHYLGTNFSYAQLNFE